MLNKAIRLVLLPAAAAVLVACGGGSANNQRVGQFVDDPVEGLTYQCAAPNSTSTPTPNVTNAMGQFNYSDGQVCTFKVGNVVLGAPVAVPSDGLVTPQDVAGVVRTATSAPSVTAIAQFLQSLSEPGVSGKLKISSATSATLSGGTEVQLVGNAGPLNQERLRLLVVQAGKTLISPAQAETNLTTQLDKLGVSKTGGAVSVGATPKLLYVSVSSPLASIAAGATLKLTATANMSNGDNSVISSAVTWSSADSSLATISGDGTVTTLKPGLVKLTGSNGNQSGVFELNIIDAVLQSLSVPTGVGDALPLGLTKALSLTGKYSDGSEKTLSSGVTWTVSSDKATVDASGVLTAKGIGDVVVTGTIAGVSKDIPLTVSKAVIQSLAISRQEDASGAVALGRTVALKAIAQFSDNTKSDIANDVTWSASNDNLAVSTGGLVTTRAAGNSKVSARSGNVVADFDLTVGPAELVSLAIGPVESMAQGLNRDLTLTGTYTDSTTSTSLVNVTWSSADSSKVTVATNGKVTGNGVGAAKVTATVGGVSTDVTVTVTEPVAKSLTASSVLATIANGAETVINAMATLTNDAVLAVAKSVNWVVESLGGQAVITITGDTVTLRGTSAGDVKVKGEYQGIFANFNVTVTPVLSGRVALGAAMPYTTVKVVDANGTVSTVDTDASGAYSLDTTALKAPFIITVTKLLGDKQIELHSVATSPNGTANVTPLTTAVSALLSANGSYDPRNLSVNSVNADSIKTATDKIAVSLANLMAQANVSATSFNPIGGVFAADGTGIDSLLDRISVDYTSTGVEITNKFVPLTDSNTSVSSVGISANATPVPLALGITPPTPGSIQAISNGLMKCFRLPVAQRLSFTTTAAGRKIYTPNSLHANCSENLADDYLSNGATYGQRWVDIFSNPDLDEKTELMLVPSYVIDTTNNQRVWPGDKHAYVYNIHLFDKNKVTYTRPELFAKIDNNLKFRGTQRRFDVSIQPQFTKVLDSNGNSNFVEGRLRIGIDPTFVPKTSSDRYAEFNFTGDSQTGQPLPKVLCAWVTGPLLQNGVQHDINNPKGGVLMVPPHSALTARRDYSAVRIKYPFDFDPKNIPAHREQLLKDCKSTHSAGTNEVGSANTNSAMTIDGAKLGADSTYVPKAYTNLSDQYPTSLTRSSCPAANTTGAVSGWCSADKRSNFVSSTERADFLAAYKDPKEIRYTFYMFVDADYTTETTLRPSGAAAAYTSYATSGTGVTPSVLATNASNFFATAQIEHTRILGAMTFVSKDSEALTAQYTGNELFRGIDATVATAYLTDGKATLAKGSAVQAKWSIPAGAEGIDRIGFGGWFNSTNGRIGTAAFSDSFAVSRGATEGSFTLSEDWYGYDYATYDNGRYGPTAPANTKALSAYREIWVRSYDRYNRQIQTVQRATR